VSRKPGFIRHRGSPPIIEPNERPPVAGQLAVTIPKGLQRNLLCMFQPTIGEEPAVK
jgi:hypothetical protein